MPAQFGADSCRKVVGESPGDAVVGDVDGAGTYLTDEVFLYYVVGFGAVGGDGMVEVEDCHRLDVVSVPARDLRARQLRLVTPPSDES